MPRAQVSFFAILGIFLVITTAGVLATVSRIADTTLEKEAARQAALNEDRILLEWYADELIRTAVLESINGSMVSDDLEQNTLRKMNELFDAGHFSTTGAGVEWENASVKLEIAEGAIIVEADMKLKLKREWGETGIAERKTRVGYDLERVQQLVLQIISEMEAGDDFEGEREFDGAKFVVEDGTEIVITDYSMFLKGEPIQIILG